jgi:hypothetical protein
MRVTVTRQGGRDGGTNGNGCVCCCQGGARRGRCSGESEVVWVWQESELFRGRAFPEVVPVQVNLKHSTRSSCASLFLAIPSQKGDAARSFYITAFNNRICSQLLSACPPVLSASCVRRVVSTWATLCGDLGSNNKRRNINLEHGQTSLTLAACDN